MPSTPAERYMQLYPELRYSFNQTFNGPRGVSSNDVKGDSATALWVLQLAHPCKKRPDPSGKRVVFMDNFYTRHDLGETLKTMTDGEVRITGTCRMNFIRQVNSIGVRKALALLEKEPRGSWALVRAYNDEGNEDLLNYPFPYRKQEAK